jgi:hypothetical protein
LEVTVIISVSDEEWQSIKRGSLTVVEIPLGEVAVLAAAGNNIVSVTSAAIQHMVDSKKRTLLLSVRKAQV